MQGRLSPIVNGMIQAFPWSHWENEFPVAAGAAFHLMEWTLDHERLAENPLMTAEGRQRIGKLSSTYDVRVASLTGDCFMQAPFWKASGAEQAQLQSTFKAIAHASGQLGATLVVVPLVDNGALASRSQEDALVEWLLAHRDDFRTYGVTILFECDMGPQELSRFIERLPVPEFGINYDIGNSASLGYPPVEEFSCYGDRIRNVHVKDRRYGGTTVPLGTGNADFAAVFEQLRGAHYMGNFILQTARSAEGDHSGALIAYRNMVRDWINA